MDSISLLGPVHNVRGALSQEDFDTRHNYVRNRRKIANKEFLEKKLIKQNWQNYETIEDFIPLIRRIRRYDIKKEGARDFVGSLLFAVLIIPQAVSVGILVEDISIAFLSLFLPQIIYFICGSARHSSLGSLSHTSFLIYCSRKYSSAEIGSLTFYVAIIQILLFLLPSEWFFSLFPSHLFVGFSLGIFIRVIIHLLTFIFAFNNCSTFYNNIKLESLLPCLGSLNVQIFILFLLTLFFAFLFRWKFNDIITQRFGTSFPHEILLILIFSGIGYFLHLDPKARLQLSPTFPAYSLPSIRLPGLPSCSLFFDAFTIAIFSFCQHFRITKSIAMEKMHQIERKQEVLTFSLISVLSSFFGLLPPSSSPGNSQINIEAAKYSLISNILALPWILLFLYFCQDLIPYVPVSVICGLIATSYSGIAADFRSLWSLCNSQPCDGFIRISSLILALFVSNCNHGFIAAAIVALLTVVYRIQTTPCEVLVKVADHFYVEENRYNDGDCLDTPLRIVKITGPLVFLNIEEVRKEIYRQVVIVKGLIGIGIGSRTVSLRSTNGPIAKDGIEKRSSTNLTNIVITHDYDFNRGQISTTDHNIPRFIVLDCSGLSAVDTEAMHMLSQVYFDLNNDHIRLKFAGVCARIRDELDCSSFHTRVPLSAFYPTVSEALHAARSIALPFHMSVSMNGYRDVIALSTAASNQDISIGHQSPEAV